ncbi:putative aminotransferase class IV, aminotransferase-like, PLP-dependent enzyme [Plasmopara halstedii]
MNDPCVAFVAEAQSLLSVDKVTLSAIPARNCTELPSAKLFLKSRPLGVYSCARVKGLAEKSDEQLPASVVRWSFHLQRLCDGITRLTSDFNQDTLILDNLKLVTQLLATTVVTKWLAVDARDGMLSVLWYPRLDRNDFGVAIHICPMPTPTCIASTVLVYGEGRVNARLKHTQWIEDRVPIEKYAAELAKMRGESIQEVILSKCGPGGDRLLLEGLVSNFFVDGAVYTADEGVLQGSTRELVLKACADLKIPVILEAPKLSERKLWQAAFVTSVVRVVIDVSWILFDGKSQNDISTARIPSDSGYTRRIREQVVKLHFHLK